MKAKQLYWLIPLLGLTFAGGRLSKQTPDRRGDSAGDSGGRIVVMSGNGVGGTGGFSPPSDSGDPAGAAKVKPLDSLQEIVDLFRSPQDGGDSELAMLPLMDLLPRLMVTDSAAVSRMLEELAADPTLEKDAELFPIAAGSLLFRWMTLQPEAAAAFALTNGERLGDLEDMSPFLIAWAARSSPGSGERLLALVPEEDRADMGALLHKQQYMSDPGKALSDPAVFQELDGSDVHGLVGKWLGKDPAAVLVWRAGLPEGDKREGVDSAILDSVLRVRDDSAEVERRLAALPPDLTKEGRLRLLGQEISDLKHASDGDQPIPNLSGYSEKLAALASGPEADSRALLNAANELRLAYVNQEKFSEGAAWICTLPEGKARDSASERLVYEWVKNDAPAASVWIDSLPKGAQRDDATGLLIGQIREEDPVNALVWANSITDPGKALTSEKDVYKSWFGTDPVAASQAVQSLSPEEQQRLSAPLAETDEKDSSLHIESNAIDSLIREGLFQPAVSPQIR